MQSPWDALPAARASAATLGCPAPPDLPVVIDVRDYYGDAAHSVIDADRRQSYDRAMRPLRDAGRRLDAMADRYRGDGPAALARCTASWLRRWAQENALAGAMPTNQAIYVQGWMLGSLAIAWLKVRADPAIASAPRAEIAAWLARVAAANRAYYDARPTKIDARNNHRYWAGLAVMATGIAADRRDLFDWGIVSFHIGTSQVAPDGTLPLEIERRSLALHYHLFAAAPLVIIAELAAANAVDLYADGEAASGALGRLVRRAASGIDDPSFFAGKAGIAQQPIKLTADDIAWAVPFERRFPDAALARLLARAPSRSMLYIGGLPPSENVP